MTQAQTLIDVLIPTYQRPEALAVTLTSLLPQTFTDFRVIIADQSQDRASTGSEAVRTAMRLLELRGHEVVLRRRLQRRGLAEQRQFLLSQARARYVLFLDDDLFLDERSLDRLLLTIEEQGCGFVGMAPIGLSYEQDVRPEEQLFEPWEGPVRPELVVPESIEWQRHVLHNAANLLHVQRRIGLEMPDRVPYKVAWVGGCVLYDRQKLCSAGGFSFWHELPREHSGEDVLAQLLVMARYGGCGIAPSGAYHLELETTVPDRQFDAPLVLRHLVEASRAAA